jgi:hypothetical protein
MKALIAISLTLTAQLRFFTANAEQPGSTQKALCEQLLTTFNKLSRGLRSELRTAHGNRKVTAFILVPDGPASDTDQVPVLELHLDRSKVEILGTYRTEDGELYIKVRGTKYAFATAFATLEIQEDFGGKPEYLWAGLRPRPRRRALDRETLIRIKDELAAEISQIPGFLRIGVGEVDGQPGIRVYVEPEAALATFREATKDFPVPVGIVEAERLVVPLPGQIPPIKSPPPTDQERLALVQFNLETEGITLDEAKKILTEAGAEVDESFHAAVTTNMTTVLRVTLTVYSLALAQQRLRTLKELSH